MEFEVLRYKATNDWTLGMLLMHHTRHPLVLGYTLEDEPRLEKVAGETRIDSGRYPLRMRTSNSGMHLRYARKFPEIHRGMIEICDVPNFTDVYMHIGNKEDQTDACLLIAETSDLIRGFIGRSTPAYLSAYNVMLPLIEREPCWITYTDWC